MMREGPAWRIGSALKFYRSVVRSDLKGREFDVLDGNVFFFLTNAWGVISFLSRLAHDTCVMRVERA